MAILVIQKICSTKNIILFVCFTSINLAKHDYFVFIISFKRWLVYFSNKKSNFFNSSEEENCMYSKILQRFIILIILDAKSFNDILIQIFNPRITNKCRFFVSVFSDYVVFN